MNKYFLLWFSDETLEYPEYLKKYDLQVGSVKFAISNSSSTLIIINLVDYSRSNRKILTQGIHETSVTRYPSTWEIAKYDIVVSSQQCRFVWLTDGADLINYSTKFNIINDHLYLTAQNNSEIFFQTMLFLLENNINTECYGLSKE